MPLIFRVMKIENGRPKVGATGMCLGVRVGPRPPPQVADITPDGNGDVHPGTGGMSVRASILDFPPMMVPTIYLRLVPTAYYGKKDRRIWKMGEGPFVSGPVAEALELRVDSGDNTHGLLEPGKAMPASGYQSALAETKDKWDEVRV